MEIDFHGWKVEEAEQEIHRMIGQARMGGGKVAIKVITGNGAIKQSVLTICGEYGILFQEQIGNTGTLLGFID